MTFTALDKYILVEKYKPEIKINNISLVTNNAVYRFNVGKVLSVGKNVLEVEEGDFVLYERGAEDLFYNVDNICVLRSIDVHCAILDNSTEALNNLLLANIKSVSGRKI